MDELLNGLETLQERSAKVGGRISDGIESLANIADAILAQLTRIADALETANQRSVEHG